MGMINEALRLADLGYKVFPCINGAKSPATQNGVKDATDDIEQVEKWFTTQKYNLGLSCEGLFILDLDRYKEGFDWLTQKRSLLLSETGAPIVDTASGGTHYYFRAPAEGLRNQTGEIALGVDVKVSGGYVIAPPSTFAGKPYTWRECCGLEDLEPEELPYPPDWLLEIYDEANKKKGCSPKATSQQDQKLQAGGRVSDPDEIIPSGQRNSTLTSLAGSLRRIGLTEESICFALLDANQRRCEQPLEENEVRKIARSICRYEPDPLAQDVAETTTVSFDAKPLNDQNRTKKLPDTHRQIPEKLLTIQGFVGDYADHIFSTMRYPNRVLAFGSALSFCSYLCGRRVRTERDTRANIYLTCLADSGVGKDSGRQSNRELASSLGLIDGIAEAAGSGEGMEDTLLKTPCMLYQWDEFDTLLRAISSDKQGTKESIVRMLLSLFSSSSSIMPTRKKAKNKDDDRPPFIRQPFVSLLGTAIPKFFYQSLTERMAENGLYSRMMILHAGERGKRARGGFHGFSDRILEYAQAIIDTEAPVDLSGNPAPKVIPMTGDAEKALDGIADEYDREYKNAQCEGSGIRMAIAARVAENSEKLALIAAMSANPFEPCIDAQAAQWAVEFASETFKTSVSLAFRHMASTEHEQKLKLVYEYLQAQGAASRADISRRFRGVKKRDMDEILESLCESGDLEEQLHISGSAGRPRKIFAISEYY